MRIKFLLVLILFVGGCSQIELFNDSIVYDHGNVSVFFCPSKDCETVYLKVLNGSRDYIYCAFFDIDDSNIENLLKNKSKVIDVRLVLDDRNFKPVVDSVKSDASRDGKYNNYMHDKFCVIDDRIVIIGSANPTYNGFFKNDNNVVVIYSKAVAENYFNEFKQLYIGKFGKEKSQSTINRPVVLSDENVSVETYFCPQEGCKDVIVDLINKAKRSIDFAEFVITEDDISQALIKAYGRGVKVRGVVEKRNINSRGSDYNMLRNFTDVDGNKYNMHNKYIIIDDSIVITGSMNPTNSGSYYNDENILVIKSGKIAKLYEENFKNLLAASS